MPRRSNKSIAEKLHKDAASLIHEKLEEIAHKFAESALRHFEEYEEIFTNLYIIGGYISMLKRTTKITQNLIGKDHNCK